MKNFIDFNENAVKKEILEILLLDRTSHKNIIWATHDYEKYGQEYAFNNEIKAHLISNKNKDIIKPRVLKFNHEQLERIKDKAEVFTPTAICNKQNNLVDNEWFGYSESFNIEEQENWKTTSKVVFPKDKDWKSYVLDKRLEITCGEAPYLTSRYDTTTGIYIETKDRIGLLDRKLRVISENASSDEEWIEYGLKAMQSIYGFEYQGDSLLIARENIYLTFIDYFIDYFNKEPDCELLLKVAYIISWNIWQMDGMKLVVPNSCHDEEFLGLDFFGDAKPVKCRGCENNDVFSHNGIKCKIMNWDTEKDEEFISFINKRF